MSASRTRECRKRRYRSKVDALIALADIQRKDNRFYGRVERRTYYHRPCRAWHLTSQSLQSKEGHAHRS